MPYDAHDARELELSLRHKHCYWGAECPEATWLWWPLWAAAAQEIRRTRSGSRLHWIAARHDPQRGVIVLWPDTPQLVGWCPAAITHLPPATNARLTTTYLLAARLANAMGFLEATPVEYARAPFAPPANIVGQAILEGVPASESHHALLPILMRPFRRSGARAYQVQYFRYAKHVEPIGPLFADIACALIAGRALARRPLTWVAADANTWLIGHTASEALLSALVKDGLTRPLNWQRGDPHLLGLGPRRICARMLHITTETCRLHYLAAPTEGTANIVCALTLAQVAHRLALALFYPDDEPDAHLMAARCTFASPYGDTGTLPIAMGSTQ